MRLVRPHISTATTVVLLLLLLLSATPPSPASPTTSTPPTTVADDIDYTCDDLPMLPPSTDRCSFVRQHCPSEGKLPLLPLYYCHIRPLGLLPALLLLILSSFLLLVLFKAMGHAADEYFSSILSQISQDCGLPPRLGGVTLLALGNGAADLSSSIAAVRSGNYPLALGALTGGSMFVGCVVAGRIIMMRTNHGSGTANGVRCKAAQIRDVSIQFVAVLMVTGMMVWGRMTYSSVGALLSLYVIYVIIVAVADFTKRAGVEWVDIGRGLRHKVSMKLGGGGDTMATPLLAASTAATTNSNTTNEQQEESIEGEVAVVGTVPTVTLAPSQTLLGVEETATITSRDGSEVELAESPPYEQCSNTNRGGVRGTTTTVPPPTTTTPTTSSSARRAYTAPTSTQSNGLAYEDLVHMSTKEYRQRALADLAASKSFYKRGTTSPPLRNGLDALPILPEDQTILEEEEEERGGYGGGADDASSDSSDEEGHEGREGQRGEEELQERGEYVPPMDSNTTRPQPRQPSLPPLPPLPDKPFVETQIDAIVAVLETSSRPFVIALSSSVPMVESSTYNRQWFITAMGLSPLFICLYAGSFSFSSLVFAGAAGTAAAAMSHVATASLPPDTAPLWTFGTGYPIGAGIVAVYGFGVAAMWIDVFASEIVGILHFFGLLAGVDSAVLGVTVLAWGNSLTDFVANTSMAGKSPGGTSMAMTACFAGPLFNMLVGLGVGFWTFLADNGVSSTPVVFDPLIGLGCLFVMLNCAGLVAVAVTNNQRLPGRFGWVMLGWYGLYLMVVACIVAF